MVPSFTRFINFCTQNVTKHSKFITTSSQQPITSNKQESLSSRLYCIRNHLKNKGLSEHVIKLICKSWRNSTSKQYDLVWNKWIIWCNKWKINPCYPSESQILSYLSDLVYSGKSYSVINTHKSAISQTLSLCDNEMISCSTVISRFMKGIYVDNPPKPKYTFTWDVSIVLRFLKTFWPLEELSLKNLTLKLVALLALSTAQRVQTLNCLKLSLLANFGDYVVFTIDELTKTSKPGKKLQKIRIDKFSDKALCVINTLAFYIKTTSKIRKTERLLMSFKTYKEVSTSSIARWLKEVLKLSGINTGIFSAHSYRGASTSCAFSSGVSLKDILTTANWTNAKTFYKFYNRDLQCSFSNDVLSTMD